MNKFETELKAGNFVTSECTYCDKIVWPPSDYCNICFKEVNWRKVSESGTIVDLSRKENDVFCITEFESKIRVMGKLDTKLILQNLVRLLNSLNVYLMIRMVSSSV